MQVYNDLVGHSRDFCRLQFGNGLLYDNLRDFLRMIRNKEWIVQLNMTNQPSILCGKS